MFIARFILIFLFPPLLAGREELTRVLTDIDVRRVLELVVP